MLDNIAPAGCALSLQIGTVTVHHPSELERTLPTVAKTHSATVFAQQRRQVVDVALENRCHSSRKRET
jgi:hypothetical protein